MPAESDPGLPPPSPEIPDYDFPADTLIGEGTYGQVWFALFKEDQPRAVKVFRPENLRRDRWREEYEKLKALDEPPGIVTLYDRGETAAGLPFVAMRLMADPAPGGGWEGRTLKKRIEADDLDSESRWRLVFEMAEILAYMHRRGIYHCDVKPSNVLLSGGDEPRAVLCDFGQSIGEGFSPDGVTGTFLYASPEQLRRQDESIESWDVYSFGVTAFELLTGRLPRLNGVAEDLKTKDGAAVLEKTIASLPADSLSFGASLDRELIPLVMVEAIEAERELAVPADWRKSRRREEFEVLLNCLALPGDRPPRYGGMSEVVAAFKRVARDRAVASERRKKTIFATLMVFGLAAAGLAAWQWDRAEDSREAAEIYAGRAEESAAEQKRLAEVAAAERDEARKARSLAEEQTEIANSEKAKALESEKVARLARSTAESLINSMLYDLKDRLEPLGRVDLLDRVSAGAEDYFAGLPESQRTEASERERSAMLNNRGEVFLALGEFGKAREAFEEGLAIRRRLLETFPEDAARMRDVSVSLERIGDAVSARGKWEEAESRFRECLEIRESLRAGDSDEALARDIAYARSKLSDILGKRGDLAGAIREAESSLKSLRELAGSADVERRAIRDLGAALLRVGDLYRQSDQADRVLPAYRESAGLLRKLLQESEPDDTAIRRDYSAALVRLGEWHWEAGDREEARPLLKEAVPLVRDLALRDPGNRDRQRNLALLLNRIGEVESAGGDLVRAEEAFRESTTLLDSLVSQNEPRPVWLEDAQAALIGWGDLLATQSRWEDAEVCYARSLELARRRAAMKVEDGGGANLDVIVSLFKAGVAAREAGGEGRAGEARLKLGEALEFLSEVEPRLEEWETVIRAELAKVAGE